MSMLEKYSAALKDKDEGIMNKLLHEVFHYKSVFKRVSNTSKSSKRLGE